MKNVLNVMFLNLFLHPVLMQRQMKLFRLNIFNSFTASLLFQIKFSGKLFFQFISFKTQKFFGLKNY